MSGGDDEIDFSSYLVDLGDEDGTPQFGDFEGSFNNAGSRPDSHQASVNVASTKHWSGSLLVRSGAAGASGDPSSPGTSSDSSYKASTAARSTPSTAASSVASTSYTGSAGSWMTEKASQQDAAGRTVKKANKHRKSVSAVQPSSNYANADSATVPRLNLSFNYTPSIMTVTRG